MKSSVFIKYIAWFSAIILISFFLLSFIISSFMSQYASDTIQKEVDELSLIANDIFEINYIRDPMSKTLNDYIKNNENVISNNFTLFNQYSNDKLFVLCTTAGKVLYIQSNSEILKESDKRISYDILKKITQQKAYTEKGDLDGFFTENFVVSGSGLYDENSNLFGYLFVCKSVRSISTLVSSINKSIFMACVWILIAALIAVYFISERISNPLRKMTEFAKDYGKGHTKERLAVVGHDEIAELSIAFNQMIDSIEETEKMRNSFLGNVSHDLRTPMTTIAGFVDGILDGSVTPEKEREKLEIVSSEAHRLSRLVSELLDLSKLESGDKKYFKKTFDICEVARIVLISCESRIESKKINIDFDVEEDNMFVFADEDAVQRIAYNLIDNAIKFTPSENGLIRISIKQTTQGKILFTVHNNGVGIPKEDLPYIFDRFYKTDKSRSLDKNGSGLGLFIVKTILVQMNESITVNSVEGEFTEFQFTIQKSERPEKKEHLEEQI